ncbi:MAG: hypothetical protein AAGI38_00225 [Bacteroidota bacterium]
MKNSEINYGVLSHVSRELNCNVLGDCSGSTISRRTTKGFKRAFNLTDHTISDQNAEHIVHAAMLGTVVCLFSKNKGAIVIGILLLLALIFFYKRD